MYLDEQSRNLRSTLVHVHVQHMLVIKGYLPYHCTLKPAASVWQDLPVVQTLSLSEQWQPFQGWIMPLRAFDLPPTCNMESWQQEDMHTCTRLTTASTVYVYMYKIM